MANALKSKIDHLLENAPNGARLYRLTMEKDRALFIFYDIRGNPLIKIPLFEISSRRDFDQIWDYAFGRWHQLHY